MDRRRLNPPAGTLHSIKCVDSLTWGIINGKLEAGEHWTVGEPKVKLTEGEDTADEQLLRESALTQETAYKRDRSAFELRPVYLRCMVTPCISGSAYLEISRDKGPNMGKCGTFKLYCAVQLSPIGSIRQADSLSDNISGSTNFQNQPISRNLVINCHIRFSTFATSHYSPVTNSTGDLTLISREVTAHLDTVLKSVILTERLPKLSCYINILILESEPIPSSSTTPTPTPPSNEHFPTSQVSPFRIFTLNLLSACTLVSTSAITQAGIECCDLVVPAVAAIVPHVPNSPAPDHIYTMVLDPSPCQHSQFLVACYVAYLPRLDSVAHVCLYGDVTNPAQRRHTFPLALAGLSRDGDDKFPNSASTMLAPAALDYLLSLACSGAQTYQNVLRKSLESVFNVV